MGPAAQRRGDRPKRQKQGPTEAGPLFTLLNALGGDYFLAVPVPSLPPVMAGWLAPPIGMRRGFAASDFGNDSFIYKVSDGPRSAQATVTLVGLERSLRARADHAVERSLVVAAILEALLSREHIARLR